MFRLALVSLAAASAALAQKDGPSAAANADPTDTSAIRLNGKRFPFNALPYQADTSAPTTDPVYRGPQSGYNNCTGAAADQTAMCQTLVVNSIDDFCLFAPPTLMDVGDAEGETVSYCTKAKSNWKSRTVPEGTFTGVQFITAPSYVEVTGFINQQNLNIPAGHYGGELDSGGQDQRGNPIGGLAYSNSLPTSNGNEVQSIMWHMFIGGGQFCMKLCDPTAPNASGICRHTLDTVGCNINVPAAYVDGQFTSCEADDQLPVATTNTAIPASSNCKTYASTDLYPVTSGVPSSTVASSTTTSSSSTATSGAATKSSSSSTKGSSGSGSTTSSGSGSQSSSSADSSTGAAGSLTVSVFGLVAGLVAFAFMA